MPLVQDEAESDEAESNPRGGEVLTGVLRDLCRKLASGFLGVEGPVGWDVALDFDGVVVGGMSLSALED